MAIDTRVNVRIMLTLPREMAAEIKAARVEDGDATEAKTFRRMIRSGLDARKARRERDGTPDTSAD